MLFNCFLHFHFCKLCSVKCCQGFYFLVEHFLIRWYAHHNGINDSKLITEFLKIGCFDWKQDISTQWLLPVRNLDHCKNIMAKYSQGIHIFWWFHTNIWSNWEDIHTSEGMVWTTSMTSLLSRTKSEWFIFLFQYIFLL